MQETLLLVDIVENALLDFTNWLENIVPTLKALPTLNKIPGMHFSIPDNRIIIFLLCILAEPIIYHICICIMFFCILAYVLIMLIETDYVIIRYPLELFNIYLTVTLPYVLTACIPLTSALSYLLISHISITLHSIPSYSFYYHAFL